MHFEYLTDIHPRGYAQWVQHDVHGCTVCHVWQILNGNDERDHAFVTVATRHFVTRLQTTFHSQIHFDHLNHACLQIIALGEFFAFFFKCVVELRTFLFQGFAHCFHIGRNRFIRHANVKPFVWIGEFFQILGGDFRAFGQFVRTTVSNFTNQRFLQTAKRIACNNSHLIFEVMAIAAQFLINNRLRTRITRSAFTRKHLHINHRTDRTTWHTQRGIFHI